MSLALLILIFLLRHSELILVHGLSIHDDVAMIPEVVQYGIYLLLLNKCTGSPQLLLVRLTVLKCNIDIQVKSLLEHLLHIRLYFLSVYMRYLTVLYSYGYRVSVTVQFSYRSGYKPVAHIAE